MKKVVSLALTAAVVMSLSACRNRNVGMGNNGGTNIGRSSGLRNISNTNRTSYSDGVYVGYGNGRAGSNERATVLIRNGRIADINLDTVSSYTGRSSGNAGTNQGRNNNGTGAGTGTSSGVGTGTGIGSGLRTRTGIGAGVGTGTGVGVGNGAGTGIGGAIGNAAGNAGNTISSVKNRLITAMIANQSDNVLTDTATYDKNTRAMVDNWKLAVSRALRQAQRATR